MAIRFYESKTTFDSRTGEEKIKSAMLVVDATDEFAAKSTLTVKGRNFSGIAKNGSRYTSKDGSFRMYYESAGEIIDPSAVS